MVQLKQALLLSILCLVFSCKLFAATSVAGELHFLEFNDAGIDMALRGQEVGQINHDPEECGSTFVFRLLSTHANYEALSGVLLTYYYSKHPLSITVAGCSGTMPVAVQFESGEL